MRCQEASAECVDPAPRCGNSRDPPILSSMQTSMHSHEWTGSRLAIALLGYFMVVIALITLVPFQFERPAQLNVTMHGTPFDIVANFLMFLAPGFLWRIVCPPRRDAAALRALALGLAVSLLIESAQLFEPARFASPLDVLANAAGAGTGALLAHPVAARARTDSVLVARLSLEIPLMGFVYLLLPMISVASLAALDQPVRLAAILLPGLAAAGLLADVHRFEMGRIGTASPAALAAAAGLGMLAALSPAVPRYPLATFGIAAVIAGATAALCHRPRTPTADRRFEQRALRTVLPLLVAWFAALPWLDLGSGSLNTLPETSAMLRLLESFAAFTLLGYLISEWHGRFDSPTATSIRRTILYAATPIAYLCAIRLLQGDAASLIQAPALALAAAFGAALYHAQRAHVRALLAAAKPLAPRPVPLYLVSTTK